MPERQPPHNLDAERSVLGSMLRDNGVIADVAQTVRDDSFYKDAHQRIYRGILALHEQGGPVDLVTLAEQLKGQIADIGGYKLLAELWDAAPSAGNAMYYAGIVRDHGVRRALIHLGGQLARDAHDGVAQAAELVSQAERAVFEMATMGSAGGAVHVSSIIQELYDRIDARVVARRSGVVEMGAPTGLIDLDSQYLGGGFQDGELTVIAARPSVGKTSLALNIVRHSLKCELSVFFVSLEQTREELVERMLCSASGVDGQRLRKGVVKQEEVDKLITAGGVLSGTPLFIDDQPSQTMLRIASNARRLKLRNALRLMVVDYLQLVEPSDPHAQRNEQVAEVSRRLKQLANELRIPIVALAQLNRSSEYRSDSKPKLSDLRESGAIEADADVVILLHRPPDKEESVLELIVAKQRNGPTGSVMTVFNHAAGKFENLAHNDGDFS